MDSLLPWDTGADDCKSASLTGDSETTISRNIEADDQEKQQLPRESNSGQSKARPVATEIGAHWLEGTRYRFRLGRRLGTGGFGLVYLATCETKDPGAGDPPPDAVALKVFSALPTPDPGKMLKRELSALLALKHDRIPKVYDWNFEPPWPFVALEYFPNGSLYDHLLVSGAMEEKEVWRIMADLLSALTAAHRASILHLDVKPANVLRDTNGGYVLTDFGISQGNLVSRGITETGLGAPLYQSPEQRRADHDAFNAATDLWGIGMTAWQAFTGVPTANLNDFRRYEPTMGMAPLREIRGDCSPHLNLLVGKLLAMDQVYRPASAAEVLAEVLTELTQDNTSPLRPDPAGDMLTDAELRGVLNSLLDPLWKAVCGEDSMLHRYRRLADGEVLCREGESSYYAYVLLSGRIRIEKNGSMLTQEEREGTFVGELTTLTGRTRTATLSAEGNIIVRAYNSLELERLIIEHPAIGIRLVKTLADRLCTTLRS